MVLLLAAALLVLAHPWAEAQEVRYVYDPKGQLIGIIDTDGSAASYLWDPSGNLLGITRTNASSIPTSVGITLVSPSQSLPQAVVEIFGKGFSTTPPPTRSPSTTGRWC